jgi:DedD protein
MEDNDVQLQLKKRARRRLVGALAFVSVVAVVLPMVMDHEPRQAVQDVEIRIPGQDERPFAPKLAAAPMAKKAEKPLPGPAVAPPESPPERSAGEAEAKPDAAPSARVLEVVRGNKTDSKPAAKAVEKPAPKLPAKPEKVPEKPEAKTAKPVEKPVAKNDDAKRAAAILNAQGSKAKSADNSDEFLVLIGAFANEANVKTLKAKLGEEGIKTFSEQLDTPQGKKTRLRAGPFPNREAAVKAQKKMQRIGVSGVVAAKQ